MSATETDTVSDLVQKMVISLCGEQKPGEVMFSGFDLFIFKILMIFLVLLIISEIFMFRLSRIQ